MFRFCPLNRKDPSRCTSHEYRDGPTEPRGRSGLPGEPARRVVEEDYSYNGEQWNYYNGASTELDKSHNGSDGAGPERYGRKITMVNTDEIVASTGLNYSEAHDGVPGRAASGPCCRRLRISKFR